MGSVYESIWIDCWCWCWDGRDHILGLDTMFVFGYLYVFGRCALVHVDFEDSGTLSSE